MSIAQEELFAPVVSILKAADEQEIISYANDTLYGLSGAIHTSDIEARRKLFHRRSHLLCSLLHLICCLI